MKLNKKGVIWPYLMAAIIALVVVILVIMWFRSSGGKAFGEVEEKLEGLEDTDGDGAVDMFDRCPCDPNIGGEFPEGITSCGVNCS